MQLVACHVGLSACENLAVAVVFLRDMLKAELNLETNRVREGERES